MSDQFGFLLDSLEASKYFIAPFANFALFKTTNISERLKVEFRVEAQNVLNERSFGVPDAFTEDASNGFVAGSFQNPGFNAGAVRQLRFGLRFLF